jgi:hypothetical protein
MIVESISVIILTILLITLKSYAADPFLRPAPHGAVGDIGDLYLRDPGVSFSPMGNDFLGETDKLNSGWTAASYMRSFRDSAFSIDTRWRFLTPIFRRAFGESDLDQPIGRFADWLEVSGTYVRQRPASPWKEQFTLGLSHVGNKGAKKVHHWVHRMSHNPTVQLEYEGQLKGFSPVAGIEYSRQLGEFNLFAAAPIKAHLAFGANYNTVMAETYAKLNFIWYAHDLLRFGAEGILALQHLSHTYEEVLPYRSEGAFSIAYLRYFQAKIKWVSTYIPGDAYGQIYLDPITINFRF